MSDTGIPIGRPSVVHTFQFFAGRVEYTPPPVNVPAVFPNVLTRRPSVVHTFQFFAAPGPNLSATVLKPQAVFPNVLIRRPSIVHTYQSYARPGQFSALHLLGYGPDGAATFALALEPGAKLTLSWGTDIFKSYAGLEQRSNTTGPRPRQRIEGNAYLLDGDNRALRANLQRSAASGATFLLALPYEELTLTADAIPTPFGLLLTVSTTTLSDWAIVTQRVLLWGVDDVTTQAVIQAVTATTITVNVTAGPTIRAGSRIMPLLQVLLDAQQGFSRYATSAGFWSIRALANVFGWVGQDVAGRGAQILTYSAIDPVDATALTDADLLIWDRPNLIEGTASDSMLSLAETVDLGALPFGIGGASQPDWARPIKHSSADPAEFQWLKAFLRQLLGRQRAFLLSTARSDLVPVSASGSALTISTDGDYAGWYASPSHRRLALMKTDGTIQYVTVTATPTDNHDGTLTLALDASVTGTVSKVSFLEQVRFDNNDSDDFPVIWNGGVFSADFTARTTEESISAAAPPQPQSIGVLWGDSNVAGEGDANNTDGVMMFGVDSAFSSVTIDSKRAPNTTDPPSFTAFGPTSLVAFNPGSVPGFGPEITFGRELFKIDPSFGYIVQTGIVASLLATHWLPTSTYMLASTGKNLYNTEVDRLKAIETATGRKTKIIVPNLGTNDASDVTAANSMDVNMAAFVTATHAHFPDAVIIWPLIHIDTVQTYTTIVRNKELSYAATAPSYFRLVNIDHLSLQDPFHWDTPSIMTIGSDLAEQGTDQMAISQGIAGPAPALVGIGVPLSGSASSLSPLGWSGTLDRHTELLFAVASGVTPVGGPSAQTVSAPSGWTPVTDGQITDVGFTTTWRLLSRNVGTGEIGTNSTPPAIDRRPVPVTVSFAGSTDNYAQRMSIEGPNPHPAVDASNSTAPNAFTTGPVSIASLSLGGVDRLVLHVVGGGVASTPATATVTAGGLTGLTKIAEAAFPYPSSGHTVLVSIWAGTALSSTTGTASVSFNVNTLVLGSAVAFAP